nr:hypothetical protein [Desulfobacula sp.]
MKNLKKDIEGIKTPQNGFVALITTLLIIFYTTNAHAHNLWIIGNADNNEAGSVHLYFEHHVGPGDGAYLGPIEKHGKTWIGISKDNWTPLTMKKIIEKDKKYLAGNAGKTEGSFSIDHTSIYGIYHGRLDFFHGRYIQATDAKNCLNLPNRLTCRYKLCPNGQNRGFYSK